MVTVTVDKQKLITILKANLVKHEQTYHEALDIFHTALTEELHELQSKIDQHQDINAGDLTISLPVPVSYGKEYRNTIAMFELCEDKMIVMSPQDHTKWVQDQWEWSGHFYSNTSNYTGRAV